MTGPSSRQEKFNLPDREALLREAGELNAEIPYAEDVGPLFEPLDVGGRRLANRLAVQPMEGADGDGRGAPGALTLRRYRRFAAGGSATIWFEAVAVDPAVRSNPRQLCLTRDTLDAFRQLVNQTREAARESMGHDVLLVVQLTHPGRYCRPEGRAAPVPAQRNPVLDPLQKIPHHHPLISDEELDRLQGDFFRAAGLAAEAGFDGVDVKACHGYLLSELLSARGREHSRYGGAFENRIRFLLETVRGIRREAPGLLVTPRINAYDGVPHPHGFGTDREDPAREDLTEVHALVRALKEAGCPLLNVTLGIPYFNPHVSRPFNTPVIGGGAPPEHPLAGVARMIRVTAALQEAAPDLPMVGTGYSWLRHHFPHVGAAVVRSGGAAVIGMGRGAFAYPDCVRELRDRGRMDPGKACIGCSCCSQIMRDGGSAGCVVRDSEIYLPEYRRGRGEKG